MFFASPRAVGEFRASRVAPGKHLVGHRLQAKCWPSVSAQPRKCLRASGFCVSVDNVIVHVLGKIILGRDLRAIQLLHWLGSPTVLIFSLSPCAVTVVCHQREKLGIALFYVLIVHKCFYLFVLKLSTPPRKLACEQNTFLNKSTHRKIVGGRLFSFNLGFFLKFPFVTP